MNENKDDSSISPKQNSENHDSEDRQQSGDIFANNISKNSISENNTSKNNAFYKDDKSDGSQDFYNPQSMRDFEDMEKILKDYEDEINNIFTSDFDDSLDDYSASLDLLFPDRNTRLFSNTAKGSDIEGELDGIEDLDNAENPTIAEEFETTKKSDTMKKSETTKSEVTENPDILGKISDSDLKELESIEKAEGLTFSNELDELTGKTIQCALIVTPLKEAKVLAAFCALSQLSVLCINSTEGAIGYIDTKNTDDAVEVVKKLTSAVIGMATILVVRKKIGIEAHLWLNGSENESIAPPLLLAQQPDFVEDLLVGEANISLLEHEGFQLINSDSLSPLKALRIINSSSSLNDTIDNDEKNSNSEEDSDLKDGDNKNGNNNDGSTNKN